MTGAQLVVAALKQQGIKTVFGYPGGAIMPIYDALYDGGVEHILCRHEQGAAMAAIGMARSTQKVAVCMATSGPGATNLVTGLADAFLDSVPLVAITYQVASSHIGTDAFQEMDVIGMSLSCTKHSYLVTDINELAPTLAEAFEVAQTGRPGPVLVDIAKDVQLGKARSPLCQALLHPPCHTWMQHIWRMRKPYLHKANALYCMWVEVYNWRMPQTQCVSFYASILCLQ